MIVMYKLIADDEFCSWRFIAMSISWTTTVLCSTPWSETLINWGNLRTNRGWDLVFFVLWIKLFLHAFMQMWKIMSNIIVFIHSFTTERYIQHLI